jgi:uncharacterized protein (DUF1778 family)
MAVRVRDMRVEISGVLRGQSSVGAQEISPRREPWEACYFQVAHPGCTDIVWRSWYTGSVPNIETRNEKLDLRLTPSAKRTLQVAALAARRSVSQFVLESALARAEETLPDRRRFGLNAKQWEAFQAALSAPPRPAPRLARLLKKPSVFERGAA